MSRSLLNLVKQACSEIGIPEPLQLFGSQNDQEKQLVALAQREGKEFANMANGAGGWQNLRTDYTFSTVVDQASYSLPSDFEYFVQKTFWDDRFKWELIGPITAQEKQILRYGVVASGPRNKFYIQNNKIFLDPTPNAVFTIAFDYYSNAWCQSESGDNQSLWRADTDVYRLDEECFIQGLKWRFLRSKGLDYQQEYESYKDDCNRVLGRDGGEKDLPLNGALFGRNHFLDGANIPDTGYGE